MASRYDPEFDRLVMARPIVDMIGDGRMEYDGPRCVDADCRTPVDDDGEMCEPCADQPHEFRQHGTRPDWCACGRIRSIAGYSPVHSGECGNCDGVGTVDDGDRLCQACRGAGGWQHRDGLIVECPKGCMTGGAA